jgi:hypothetical protein
MAYVPGKFAKTSGGQSVFFSKHKISGLDPQMQYHAQNLKAQGFKHTGSEMGFGSSLSKTGAVFAQHKKLDVGQQTIVHHFHNPSTGENRTLMHGPTSGGGMGWSMSGQDDAVLGTTSGRAGGHAGHGR